MIWSDTEIGNISLSHLGNGLEIADLWTEDSAEARVLRAFWKPALYNTLRDFKWPFATKFADLGLVGTDPTEEWAYSYMYPADCLYFRRILSGTRMDVAETAVPYIFAYGATGQLIYTDKDTAQCEYTVLVEQTARWPADFVMAHSCNLAALSAPRLLGGDAGKLGARAFELYVFYGGRAQATALNEQRRDPDPLPELIRVRN